MRLGFVEIFLLVGITLILFGPAIAKKIKKYQNLYGARNKRLQKVTAQRKAERLAQEKIRNAKIKMVAFSVLGAGVLFGAVYLAVWPVSVPVHSYQRASGDATMDLYGQATEQAPEKTLPLTGYRDFTQVRYQDDWIYAATAGGEIIRVRENGTGLTELVATGGEIMSFDFDPENNIIFTDARYDDAGGALLKASFDGFAVTVEPLLSYATGDGLSFPTGVEVATDGTIYFLNATGVSAVERGSALQALRTAQIAHTQDGTLSVYDPARKTCEVMVSGLCVGAGLALSAQEDVLYLSQFAAPSVWAVAVDTRGQALGADGTSLICEGHGGYPAGLSVTEDDTLLVSLFSPEMQWFESLSSLPALREVLLRLPQGTRDALMRYHGTGMIAALGSDGQCVAGYTGARTKDWNMLTNAVQIGNNRYAVQAGKRDGIGYFER